LRLAGTRRRPGPAGGEALSALKVYRIEASLL